MSEKLQLPNPAPKGCEHEKWKAMVDSVIEFISASRAMLYVLNERIKMTEMVKEEEEKKLEDEKTKLEVYKECLDLADVKPGVDSDKEPIDSGTLQTMKECGDYNANINAIGRVDQICSADIKDEKDCKTENTSTEIINNNKSNVSENTENQPEIPQNTDENIINANTSTNTSTETKTDEICIPTVCRRHASKVHNMSKEMQSSHIEYSTKEIQHSPGEKDGNTPSLVEQKEIMHTNCSSQSECKLIKCRRKAALENVNKTMTESDVKSLTPCSKGCSSHPSMGAPIKCHRMASRIPRTKSYTEGKSKCTLIERTPNEGANINNTQCLKRCQKEVTYRTIHQRNKSPKGDSVPQL